jgi:hypothetical protein
MIFELKLPSSNGGWIAALDTLLEISRWLRNDINYGEPLVRKHCTKGQGGFEREIALMNYAIITGNTDPVKACSTIKAEKWTLALAQHRDIHQTIILTVIIDDDTIATQCKLTFA